MKEESDFTIPLCKPMSQEKKRFFEMAGALPLLTRVSSFICLKCMGLTYDFR